MPTNSTSPFTNNSFLYLVDHSFKTAAAYQEPYHGAIPGNNANFFAKYSVTNSHCAAKVYNTPVIWNEQIGAGTSNIVFCANFSNTSGPSFLNLAGQSYGGGIIASNNIKGFGWYWVTNGQSYLTPVWAVYGYGASVSFSSNFYAGDYNYNLYDGNILPMGVNCLPSLYSYAWLSNNLPNSLMQKSVILNGVTFVFPCPILFSNPYPIGGVYTGPIDSNLASLTNYASSSDYVSPLQTQTVNPNSSYFAVIGTNTLPVYPCEGLQPGRAPLQWPVPYYLPLPLGTNLSTSTNLVAMDISQIFHLTCTVMPQITVAIQRVTHTLYYTGTYYQSNFVTNVISASTTLWTNNFDLWPGPTNVEFYCADFLLYDTYGAAQISSLGPTNLSWMPGYTPNITTNVMWINPAAEIVNLLPTNPPAAETNGGVTISMSLTGTNLVIVAHGGTPGGTFKLQSTTDFSSFSTVYTNTFDGTGAAAMSFAVPPPQISYWVTNAGGYSTGGGLTPGGGGYTPPSTNLIQTGYHFYRLKM